MAVVGTVVELSVLQCSMLLESIGEASWHQRWHTKGSVFPFTVVCTCQNGVFCCFVAVLCSPPAPALLLCSTTETPGGIGKCSSVCACVWSRRDASISNPFIQCPTHTLTQSVSLGCGQCFVEAWDKMLNRSPTRDLAFCFLFFPSLLTPLLSSEHATLH